MSENIINTTNVNDTINTQQTEKQETVLVDNIVAENNGEQQPKAKKHTKLSEFEKMAGTMVFSGTFGIGINALSIFYSTLELTNEKDNLPYRLTMGFNIVDLCKNIYCLTYASIKLSKLKKKNKELKTETVLENDEEKQNEVIPEEKKQEDKQIKTTTANQELKNKSEELEKLNNELGKNIIPEEKKQEEAEIERRGLQRQKLQRQVKIYTLSNSKLENKLNSGKSKSSREH